MHSFFNTHNPSPAVEKFYFYSRCVIFGLTRNHRIQLIFIIDTMIVSWLYISSFKLPLRWLRSFTPVTYLCTLQGIHSLAALMQLE
ncbi:hypothetical protein CCO50_19715 [Salmonella enterica subsp. enterica serovar Hato]|nr:hypothetical protein SEEA1960_023090 [Salmonella enterica subsp. enterica serovar Albany str. ATCC 51960]APY34373.1 hypothetical protein LFZ5_21385 [Salmonella enterica subsp. enterica serovar Apapa str. SA20060561]APY47991.1 hypothetical protein LFZ6_20925 [Salmonella enterica subsp. enterica serovar Borreze str. SA20041063]APY74798.1 hypothetical protein LFZ24_21865 [Salmonella enterica subsp. enterica serovar Krefeld str. SA20030536]APZ58993.1 hypothetical protein LFZ3_19835 [Salmonella e